MSGPTIQQVAEEAGLRYVTDAEPGIRRRRQCIACGERFTTVEAVQFSTVQILKRDDVTELEARYVIETKSGLVYVVNNGVRSGPKHVMDALARGEKVDPSLVYFRAVPKFETSAPDLLWLTRKIFICSGVRLPDQVILRFYELQ